MEYKEKIMVVKDLNKKISSIAYNCLNLHQRCEPRLHSAKRHKVSLPSLARALPSKITYGNGRTIAYVYDASGRKMQRTVYTPKVAVLNPRANELLMSGAKLGGFVGAWGGVTVIPCAIIGGVIGGFAGAMGGSYWSGSLVDYFYNMGE